MALSALLSAINIGKYSLEVNLIYASVQIIYLKILIIKGILAFTGRKEENFIILARRELF